MLIVHLKGRHFPKSIFIFICFVTFDISDITVCFCYCNLGCLDVISLGILMIMSIKVILKVLLSEHKKIRNSTFLCSSAQNYYSVLREVCLDHYKFVSSKYVLFLLKQKLPVFKSKRC